MESGRATLLIFSQLFYTLVGAMINIFLGITIRDLPNLPCSTYYVILANISVCNLIICTFTKTILSIYISYAFIKDEAEVDLQFCPVFTMMYWTTLPVLPISIFLLSWHLYLGSRRAEERALNVPKYAMSIFLMMIPLATAVFEAGKKTSTHFVQSELMKQTEEQKRKIIKSVSIKEGPRPRQIALIALIWMVSTFFGFERIFALQKKEKGSLVREYFIRPLESSSKEIAVYKDEDTLSCTVWNDTNSVHGLLVWILFGFMPILLGPVLASLLELTHYVRKKCSRSPHPATPSTIRYWVVTLGMAAVTLSTYTLHLWLAETFLATHLGWDYFTSLTVKYFYGSFEIFLVPLVPLFLDKNIRDGVSHIMTAKKKGILSKQNSVYSEYL